MQPLPIHRDFSLDQALRIVNDSLKQFKMNIRLNLQGSAGNLVTYLCLLQHEQLKLSFRGAGSGLKLNAQVKAIYEALEEALLYQFCLEPTAKIRFYSTLTSPCADLLKKLELLPAVFNQFKATHPWIELQHLGQKNQSLYYPMSLFCPHLAYQEAYVNQTELTALANSTGIAIGANFEEAVLHGINDWIERDAYGIFLLTTIIKPKYPARCVKKASLPNALQKHILHIENLHEDELYIIDITTNFNIPAFLVSFTRQKVPVQPSGLGAALCKAAALELALLEALQARDRYNQNTHIARRKILAQYQAQPPLLAAFTCDMALLSRQGRIQNVTWDGIANPPLASTLSGQIDWLVNHLKNFEVNIYCQTLFNDRNHLHLVYVLLSGIETFGTMREGLFTPIKKRGKAALQ